MTEDRQKIKNESILIENRHKMDEKFSWKRDMDPNPLFFSKSRSG